MPSIYFRKAQFSDLDLSMHEFKRNDCLERVAKRLGWGTYGKKAKHHPLCIEKTLWDLDDQHLENILTTQYQITPMYKYVIIKIMKYRAGRIEKIRGDNLKRQLNIERQMMPYA